VDVSAAIHRVFSEADWQAAWHESPEITRIVRQVAKSDRGSCRDTLFQSAYFAAGRLHDEGFTLFNNGGQPLLRRHRDAWLDEIVFRAPTTGVDGIYCPVSVEIMVSLHALEEVRAKYSRSYLSVSPLVASVNIGEFEIPPCRILWNVIDDGAIHAIGDRLATEVLDWIDLLDNPVSLEQQVSEHRLPLVDDVTGLEMVLSLGGSNSARRVFGRWLEEPKFAQEMKVAIDRHNRQFGPVYRCEDPTENLAVLCTCFNQRPSKRRSRV
jgi:hypothetical protein